MKALVGAFNQEKALVVVQLVVEPMEQYTALIYFLASTQHCIVSRGEQTAGWQLVWGR